MKFTIISKMEIEVDMDRVVGEKETGYYKVTEAFRNGTITVGQTTMQIVDEDGNEMIDEDEEDNIRTEIIKVLKGGEAE